MSMCGRPAPAGEDKAGDTRNTRPARPGPEKRRCLMLAFSYRPSRYPSFRCASCFVVMRSVPGCQRKRASWQACRFSRRRPLLHPAADSVRSERTDPVIAPREGITPARPSPPSSPVIFENKPCISPKNPLLSCHLLCSAILLSAKDRKVNRTNQELGKCGFFVRRDGLTAERFGLIYRFPRGTPAKRSSKDV